MIILLKLYSKYKNVVSVAAYKSPKIIQINCLDEKKKFRAVDISISNLCGISGVKVWDHLIKGFPTLH